MAFLGLFINGPQIFVQALEILLRFFTSSTHCLLHPVACVMKEHLMTEQSDLSFFLWFVQKECALHF